MKTQGKFPKRHLKLQKIQSLFSLVCDVMLHKTSWFYAGREKSTCFQTTLTTKETNKCEKLLLIIPNPESQMFHIILQNSQLLNPAQ